MTYTVGKTYRLPIGYWRCDAAVMGGYVGTLYYADGQVRQRGYVIPTR